MRNTLRKSDSPHRKMTDNLSKAQPRKFSKTQIYDFNVANYKKKLSRNKDFQFYRWVDKTLASPRLYDIPKRNTQMACSLIAKSLSSSGVDFKNPDYRNIADQILQKLIIRLKPEQNKDTAASEITSNFAKQFDNSNELVLFSCASHLAFIDNFFDEIGSDRVNVWLRYGSDIIGAITTYFSGRLELFGQGNTVNPLIKAGEAANIPLSDREMQNEYIMGFKKAGLYPKVLKTYEHLLFLEKILSLKGLTDGNPIAKAGTGYVIYKLLPENTAEILNKHGFTLFVPDIDDGKFLVVKHDNPGYIDQSGLTEFGISHKNVYFLELNAKEEINNFRVKKSIDTLFPKGIYENTNVNNLKALSKTLFNKYSELEKDHFYGQDEVSIFDYDDKNKLLQNASDLSAAVAKIQ